MPVTELTAGQLYRRCEPRELDFTTTEALPPLDEEFGQPRAIAALEFGVSIGHEGFNLFALGPEGLGKRTLVKRFLERAAERKSPPLDWCYVNNFDEPHRPRALSLPAGKGKQLREDMERLTEDLGTSLAAAFESDEYRTRKQVIDEQFNKKPEAAFAELHAHAHDKKFAVLRTPVGVVFAPTRDGEVIPPEEIAKLPDADKERLQRESEELEAEFQKLAQRLPEWERERRNRLRELNREVTSRAVAELIAALRRRYCELPDVCGYLDAVEQDVIENAAEIIKPQPNPLEQLDIPLPEHLTGAGTRKRYQVNVLVDHGDSNAAPVVIEDNPTYVNLIGRVEHMSQLGTLLTDYRLIRAGALHRANGGYLVLDARNLLMQPYSWEGLKRALRSREIRVESLGQALSLITTVALEPEAIPLDVKVVLLGDRRLYYLLSALDPEFQSLFKVEVDFDDQIDRTVENDHLYARMIATIVRQHALRPLDCHGVARVLEYSARDAGDAQKLSTHMSTLVDLLREADHLAAKADRQVIDAGDVQAAIDARIYRSDRVRERMQEQILRETIFVDTEGTQVGQINGLSVLQLGSFSFGRASRITASVRLGRGKLTDIEREVELGGPIHSKGVLILSSFLAARYAADRPLALAASIVFEQSYSSVEGDSASCAELFALLSAIANVPLRQSLAVTGSMNQHGVVQPIGGVNEKIEGFFDLCKARGLTGRQGVVIPAANIKNLMLRAEVVEAVERGEFHIYPIATVDEGIELLTGLSAGELDDFGNYPAGSINLMVETRLGELADKLAEFGRDGSPEQDDEEPE